MPQHLIPSINNNTTENNIMTLTENTYGLDQAATIKQALDNLAILGGKLFNEDDIIFEGDRLVIPERMTLMDAHHQIGRRIADEEQEYSFTRTFDYLPLDGARATALAIKRTFGFTIGMRTQSFFGSNPPQLRTIDVAYGKTEQVPWGRLGIPGIDDAYLDLMATPTLHGPCFAVSVSAKRRDKERIDGLLNVVQVILDRESIYKGQAIYASEEPKFIDLSGVDFDDVIYTEEVAEQILVHIWADIMYGTELRAAGQPSKRTVWVEGPYGGGKTKLAELTAKKCVEMGLTFTHCRGGEDNWLHAMYLGRKYGGVVFIEDADLLSRNSDKTAISRLLEQFDGLEAKGANLDLVLTTNHIEEVNAGMLRFGRSDAVIHIAEMDRPGIERLTRRVIGRQLAEDVDFDAIYAEAMGYTPSTVREALNRVVRYNVVTNKGGRSPVSTAEIIGAMKSLKPQLALMEAAPVRPQREGVDGALSEMIQEAANAAADQAIEYRIHGARLLHIASGEERFEIQTN